MNSTGNENENGILFRLFFDIESKAGGRVEKAIQSLIVANVFLMMFPLRGTFQNTNAFLEWLCPIGEHSENWFLFVFSLELLARSWTALHVSATISYLSGSPLILSLSCLPSFYISFLWPVRRITRS